MAKERYPIRDVIHGFVELTPLEKELLDTRPLQRLRDIHQLGMGHMVYPGANHTRLEHSIGCVHVMDAMFSRIAAQPEWQSLGRSHKPDEYRQLARLGALLHDVGHAPFSHAGEHLFADADFTHESMTAILIRDSEIKDIIANHDIDPEEVILIATDSDLSQLEKASSRHDLEILNNLLAGEIGADRCDYLLRDSYHSGQPAGSFDLARLTQQLALIDLDGATYPGIREGGRIAAEQMIANRFAAYIDLYFHKTKVAYELHLEQFLARWLPDGVYPTKIDEYLGLTDSVVLNAMRQSVHDQDGCSTLAARVLDRDHFKLAFERLPSDRKGVLPEKIQKFKAETEKVLGSSGFVSILNHSGTKIRTTRGRMLVEQKSRVQSLRDLAELANVADRIWRLRVYCSKENKIDVGQSCSKRWQLIATAEEGNQ